jgi:hypothetical protein
MLSFFISKSSEVMVLPQGGIHRSRAINSRVDKRRRDAVQTRILGGCSGGGWPRPSARESFRWTAILPDVARSGATTVADMPVKHFDMHAAMKTHLSQSRGAGAFDGQHGMSFAISSVVGATDMSGIACIDMSEDISAMAGRETGAKARPAIKRIASSRRKANLRFTDLNSHTLAVIETHGSYTTGVPVGGN